MSKKYPKYLAITPDDIGGRCQVVVSIEPKSTQDVVSMAQIAQGLRTPGADGRPIMSDRDIHSLIFKFPHPERIAAGVEQQMLERMNPEIQELTQKAGVEEWRKEHKDIVRIVENPDGEEMITMTESEFKQQVMDAAKLLHAQMMGQDVQGMVGNAMIAGQTGTDVAGAMQGAGEMPMPGGGMTQAALPEQFKMTPAQEIPEPTANNARKMRRGKPQNKPKGKSGY